MPSYFQFQPYDDRGSNIGALMMAPAQAKARALREAGAAQARAAEIGGQATAGAINSIGNIISGGIQQYQQHQADAPRREMEALQLQGVKDQQAAAQEAAETQKRQDAAFRDLLSRDEMPDPREILTIYGPERGSKIAQGLESFAKISQGQVDDARSEAGRLAAGMLALSPEMRKQLAPQVRAAAIQGGLGTEETIPTDMPDDFLRGILAWSSGRAPEPPKLMQRDPTRDLVNEQTGEVVTPGTPEVKMREVVVRGPNGGPVKKLVPESELIQGVPQYERPRAAAPTVNISTGADIAPPTDPESQDLMSQAGLSYNGFLALTGRMSQLPRDKETRNRASAEVAAWARERGMDVATLASQYKAYNEALENNIARYNRTLLAEGEIAASVQNLKKAAEESGLGGVRAINAAKQWLKDELNDPNAAQYKFFLNQLVNDIALYNASSQGRATLQADLEDAKSVVRRGIASGSLEGMQKAITQSVEKMGTVLEGAVNRSRKNVWDLFGVGDKYKPKTSKPQTGGGGAPSGAMGLTYQDYLKSRNKPGGGG